MTEEIMNQNIQEIPTEVEETAETYDLAYILNQLEKIASDTAYLTDALHQLQYKEDGAFAIGVGNAVEAREQTNRKLIESYLEIYRDMKQTTTVKFSSAYAEKMTNQLMDAIMQCGPEDSTKMGYLQNTLKFVLNQQIMD